MFLLHLASCLPSCRAWDAQYDSGYGAWHADNDGTWTEENTVCTLGLVPRGPGAACWAQVTYVVHVRVRPGDIIFKKRPVRLPLGFCSGCLFTIPIPIFAGSPFLQLGVAETHIRQNGAPSI